MDRLIGIFIGIIVTVVGGIILLFFVSSIKRRFKDYFREETEPPELEITHFVCSDLLFCGGSNDQNSNWRYYIKPFIYNRGKKATTIASLEVAWEHGAKKHSIDAKEAYVDVGGSCQPLLYGERTKIPIGRVSVPDKLPCKITIKYMEMNTPLIKKFDIVKK